MKRRSFLKTLSGSIVGSHLLSNAEFWLPNRGGLKATLDGWAWVHGGPDRSSSEWLQSFSRLSDSGLKGVLVSGGDVDMLSDAAHEAGLEFHRWLWILNRAGDNWAKDNHPEWFTLNRNLESSLHYPPYVGYYKWVCPTRQPVREYIGNLIAEVARNPGVDGIHLDYIRHPDVILPRGLWSRYDLIQDREYPEFDHCYCEVCRETFEGLHGVDPLDLPDPPADDRWKQFRWDSITRLVNALADSVHAGGKIISAAVFPTPSMAKLMVHQEWDRWNLDMFFPMIYHSFYEEGIPWVEQAAREGVEALPAGKQLHAGLYLPALDSNELGQAIRRSQAGGAAGVAFFEMGGLSDGHLEEIRRVLVEGERGEG